MIYYSSLNFVKTIHFFLSKLPCRKFHFIIMIFQSFIRSSIKIIHDFRCIYHKILNSKCEIHNLNNCNDGSDKTNSHNSCKHRFLIDSKYPLTLKLIIDFSFFIKSILKFNINKCFIGLHYELI